MRNIWILLSLLLLAGCDKPGEESGSGDINADAMQVEEAVEEASRHSGELADESADCGEIEWLLEHLPGEIEGLTQTYRGCESPVTALVLFENEQRSQMASITVLKAELAGLDDSGLGQWREILRDTRAGVLRELADQVAMMETRDDEPQPGKPEQVLLEDGTGALLFNADDSWQLLAIVDEDYAIKFLIEDDSITTTDQARELVEPMLVNLDLPLAGK